MTKYIIKYFFIRNGDGYATDDYAIRVGDDPDIVKFNFIAQFREKNPNCAVCVTNIKECKEEEIDLKKEIEKLKVSAKEMLETLEKIKL